LQGHYLIPGINFQCRVKLTRLHGLIIVTSPSVISGYIQIWRDNISKSSREIVWEAPLDVQAGYTTCNYTNQSQLCVIDYELPPELQIVTEVGDFAGFFSIADPSNRPVFIRSGQTGLSGYQNLCNQQNLPLTSDSETFPLFSFLSPVFYFDFGMFCYVSAYNDLFDFIRGYYYVWTRAYHIM